VFERFTERARQAIVLAQDESRRLQHDYIGTEHLLLGLLREEEGIAARVLESLGVAYDEVRAQVARIVGYGSSSSSSTGQIPFTPRAKKVLELSLREALALGHNHIGTEHVLLGVARENNGVASRILLDFGVDADAIRSRVVDTLGRTPATGMPRPRRGGSWEHRVEHVDVAALTAGWLDEQAADGWELVAILPERDARTVVFKRPRRGD
jgi:ATP-dependent Clp protease ATP-binding subunit ClpC